MTPKCEPAIGAATFTLGMKWPVVRPEQQRNSAGLKSFGRPTIPPRGVSALAPEPILGSTQSSPNEFVGPDPPPGHGARRAFASRLSSKCIPSEAGSNVTNEHRSRMSAVAGLLWLRTNGSGTALPWLVTVKVGATISVSVRSPAKAN